MSNRKFVWNHNIYCLNITQWEKLWWGPYSQHHQPHMHSWRNSGRKKINNSKLNKAIIVWKNSLNCQKDFQYNSNRVSVKPARLKMSSLVLLAQCEQRWFVASTPALLTTVLTFPLPDSSIVFDASHFSLCICQFTLP